MDRRVYVALFTVILLAVLLTLTTVQALPSGEDWRTGDKPAIDSDGTGTKYTFSGDIKSDPHHITIVMPNYNTWSYLDSGSYVWSHGDEFYIDASTLYSTQGKASGTYRLVAHHFIVLYYKDTALNYSATDSHFDPDVNPFLYASFSLTWGSTGTKTVTSWSNGPTVNLKSAQGDYIYLFASNSGALSGGTVGGVTVYSGTYVLKLHSWFQLTTPNSGGGGGSSGYNVPLTISIALINQTEATNFTARVTGSWIGVNEIYWHSIDSQLHSLYSPSMQLNGEIFKINMRTTRVPGLIAGQLLKTKSTPTSCWWSRCYNNYGEYLTGTYLVRAEFWTYISGDSISYYTVTPSGQTIGEPFGRQDFYQGGHIIRSFQALNSQNPSIYSYTVWMGSVSWSIYGYQPVVFEFQYWKLTYLTSSGWQTVYIYSPSFQIQPDKLGIDAQEGVKAEAYFVARPASTQQPVINLGLGTMYLPGEGISTPWLENMSNWAWNGTWTLNVTELYRVNEHIAMILTDGSNVRVVDLPNGSSIKVYLPAGWKNNKYVKTMGQIKMTQIPPDKNTLASAFPAVNLTVNGNTETWYLVALAAWNPYKQFSGGYDTSCWLSNGTTLAVYNLTYTYTFKNGTRVVFKEPVVVSTLKTSAMPIYSYGNMKQGLSLKVTVKWKYLPPARTGIQPNPPSSVTGVAVIGNTVYNGTLIDSNSTSKTFLVTITDDTWTLYSKGVTSVTASAYWLSSMGTPEGPVAMQDPAQLSIAYVMPHIDSITEGTSLTATVSILDAKSSQTYSGNIYVELRDPNTMTLVASYGPLYVPGSGTITINFALVTVAVSTR
jgi:hypothetical protein